MDSRTAERFYETRLKLLAGSAFDWRTGVPQHRPDSNLILASLGFGLAFCQLLSYISDAKEVEQLCPVYLNK